MAFLIKFLVIYNNSSLLIKKKARILTLVNLLLIFFSFTYSIIALVVTKEQMDVAIFIPATGLLLINLFIVKKGNFYVASNFIILLTFCRPWHICVYDRRDSGILSIALNNIVNNLVSNISEEKNEIKYMYTQLEHAVNTFQKNIEIGSQLMDASDSTHGIIEKINTSIQEITLSLGSLKNPKQSPISSLIS